jgi:hypothetical protein
VRRRQRGTELPSRRRTGGSPTTQAATPTASPGPAGTPTRPSTIRRVGDQIKQVTNQIPIAGEQVGQVVDVIVETAESLPVPLPEATAAVASSS